MPTSLQTLRVTRSLSPVNTLTVTPCCRKASIALDAVSLGGSRNARYPVRTRSHSSALEKVGWLPSFLVATASTRKPSSLNSSTCWTRSPARIGSIGKISPSLSKCVHLANTASGAPLVSNWRSPFVPRSEEHTSELQSLRHL